MRHFLRLARERKWVSFLTVEGEGEIVAYLLGFSYDRSYLAHNMAFIEKISESSPGKLLLHHAIQRCFDKSEMVSEVDLSQGDTYLKSLWCSKARPHWRVVQFGPGVYYKFLRWLVFGIRPRIKRILLSKSTIHRGEGEE